MSVADAHASDRIRCHACDMRQWSVAPKIPRSQSMTSLEMLLFRTHARIVCVGRIPDAIAARDCMLRGKVPDLSGMGPLGSARVPCRRACKGKCVFWVGKTKWTNLRNKNTAAYAQSLPLSLTHKVHTQRACCSDTTDSLSWLALVWHLSTCLLWVNDHNLFVPPLR